MKIGDARVSTVKQDLAPQEEMLKESGGKKSFTVNTCYTFEVFLL